MNEIPAYGLWSIVIINSLIFIVFAFSFTRPKTKSDWRTFGAFSAFIIALFSEMYGIPLTIYLLSGWLQTRYPSVDFLSHNSGHLWYSFMGMEGNAHFTLIHLLSNLLLMAGFIILIVGWKVLHRAQKKGQLATKGIYSIIRHPQYMAFILILFAFLIMWPTILTILMFPVLVYMYLRLATKEEEKALIEFGELYLAYIRNTPAFWPFRAKTAPQPQHISLDNQETNSSEFK